jgi:hypothetical protein
VLKGEVEFSPAYKRFGDYTGDDVCLDHEFLQNWVALAREEEARLVEYEAYRNW